MCTNCNEIVWLTLLKLNCVSESVNNSVLNKYNELKIEVESPKDYQIMLTN